MKFLGVIISILLLATSCRKYCDPSTAEGAAECSCKLIRDFKEAKGDQEKTKEVEARYDEFMTEFDKNISEGNYTENDVNEIINQKNNCK